MSLKQCPGTCSGIQTNPCTPLRCIPGLNSLKLLERQNTSIRGDGIFTRKYAAGLKLKLKVLSKVSKRFAGKRFSPVLARSARQLESPFNVVITGSTKGSFGILFNRRPAISIVLGFFVKACTLSTEL